MDEWRKKYELVLKSSDWKALKHRLFVEKDFKCERCKLGRLEGINLDLHHKNYERLGKELDSDVELLCRNCHKIADKERAITGWRKSERALYQARLAGFIRAKYGDNYDGYIDDNDKGDFDEWLESKDY